MNKGWRPSSLHRFCAHRDDPRLHKGLTSQDVIDSANSMALAEISTRFTSKMNAAADKFAAIDNDFSNTPLLARTRMQAALPIDVHDRLMIWSWPLTHLESVFTALRPQIEIISLAGPVGTGINIDCDKLAIKLGLNHTASWHNNRASVINFGNWLAKLTGHNCKIGQDIVLMAQQGIDAIKLAGGGGSSAMPHKSNPICAKIMVTLARYNAAQIGGLHQAIVHELERSDTAWTLEWLILQQMIGASEAPLNMLLALLDQIEAIGD